MFHKTAVLEINDEFIFAKDEGTESKILTKELEEIVEIPAVILTRLKGGQSFVLPKGKINNTAGLKGRLKELACSLT